MGDAIGAGIVEGGTVKEVKVGTRAGIPVDAAAVVINVTAVDATGPSYTTVYTCDQAVPVASNLNFVAGQNVPNLVVTRMSGDGRVCIYAGPGGGAHFIVDAPGYFPAGTDFVGLPAPARLLDTRPGTTTVDGHAIGAGVVAANTVKEVKVGTRAGIPVDAAAVVINVTAVDTTGARYATVYACDQPTPVASNLNFVAGQNVPNLVVTRMSSDGKVCIYAGPGGGAHFIVDAIGYLPAGTDFVGLPVPARMLDTRPGATTIDGHADGSGFVTADSFKEFKVVGRVGIPKAATIDLQRDGGRGGWSVVRHGVPV